LTEARKEYKKSKQSANRVISVAKEKKQKECESDSNDPNHQNEIFQIAKQMVKEREDIMGSNFLKEVSGRVTVDEKGIKDSWKEYMEKLLNEENEWDQCDERPSHPQILWEPPNIGWKTGDPDGMG